MVIFDVFHPQPESCADLIVFIKRSFLCRVEVDGEYQFEENIRYGYFCLN